MPRSLLSSAKSGPTALLRDAWRLSVGDAGTFSNTTGLTSDLSCTPVGSGFWAPTGSILPEACPASRVVKSA